MKKIYHALGFMSGTSGDGVDSSIIRSDGLDYNMIEFNCFNPYPAIISDEIHRITEKINDSSDLLKFSNEIIVLEKKLTNFHAEIANKLVQKLRVDIIGFHGQTIFHDAEKKISRQIGLGQELSKVTKRIVVFDFRQNDLKNNGEGAPLTPIYHQTLIKQLLKIGKVKVPVTILNIGGIANITNIEKDLEISSMDVGPGNCLIDKWMRKNSDKFIDKNGDVAKLGKIDKFILEQYLDNFYYSKISKQKSLDINDFDISFAKGLSLENGAATITELTAEILSKKLKNKDIYICGGGRKNKFLVKLLKNKVSKNINLIDSLDIDGDFVESQAFAFLAIRSYLGLPISFPNTTGCTKPISGGVVAKNF